MSGRKCHPSVVFKSLEAWETGRRNKCGGNANEPTPMEPVRRRWRETDLVEAEAVAGIDAPARGSEFEDRQDGDDEYEFHGVLTSVAGSARPT